MGILSRLFGRRESDLPPTSPSGVTVLTRDRENAQAWEAMLDQALTITSKTDDVELREILVALGRDEVEKGAAQAVGFVEDEPPNARFSTALSQLGWDGRVELVSSLKGQKSIHVYRRTGK